YFGAGHGIIIGEVQGIERGELRYFGPVGDSVGMVLLLGYLASLCFANLAGTALFLGGIQLTAGLGAMLAAAVGTGFFFAFGARTRATVEKSISISIIRTAPRRTRTIKSCNRSPTPESAACSPSSRSSSAPGGCFCASPRAAAIRSSARSSSPRSSGCLRRSLE